MTDQDERELLLAAESIYDGWYADQRIDWEDFLDRLEAQGFDIGDDLLSPKVKRIKAHVRRYARQQ